MVAELAQLPVRALLEKATQTQTTPGPEPMLPARLEGQ
jgi:hypothetical protein